MAWPRRSAAAVAFPTASGVVASGAGGMPAVIRPVTNPGPDQEHANPVPCNRSASPRAKAFRPGRDDLGVRRQAEGGQDGQADLAGAAE